MRTRRLKLARNLDKTPLCLAGKMKSLNWLRAEAAKPPVLVLVNPHTTMSATTKVQLAWPV